MSLEIAKTEVSKNQTSNVEKNNFDPDKRIDIKTAKLVSIETDYNPDRRLSNDLSEGKEWLFLSSRKEILDRTPSDNNPNAYWSGIRGFSNCYPDLDSFKGYDAYIKMNEYGMEYVPYKDGIPDFTACTEETVSINMTADRPANFEMADDICTEKWNREIKDGKNNWTARDVKEYRKENKMTWHECIDRTTCQLIPTIIHEVFIHLGGFSECKKMEGTEQ